MNRETIDHSIDHFQGILLDRFGKLGIDRRGFWAAVSHLFLNGAQIESCFEKVGTVAVSETRANSGQA